MFNLIDIGERAGSGIPNIFWVWREQGWGMPTITEQLEPEGIRLVFSFEKIGDKRKNEGDDTHLSYRTRRSKGFAGPSIEIPKGGAVKGRGIQKERHAFQRAFPFRNQRRTPRMT